MRQKKKIVSFGGNNYFSYLCQLKRKDIKKFLKIAAVVLLIIVVLIGTALILLNNSKIQTLLTQKITAAIKEKTSIDLTIEQVKINFFDNISLKKVCLTDQNDAPLLCVDDLSVSYSLLELLQRELVVKKVALNDFEANIVIDSAGRTNFQFIIDALSTGKEVVLPSLLIPQISLSNGSIAMARPAADTIALPANRLNVNNIQISDFNLLLGLALAPDKIDLSIFSASLKEKSGLSLSNLQTRFVKDADALSIDGLHIDFPKSTIQIDTIGATLAKFGDGTIDAESTQIALNVSKIDITPSDFGALYLPLYSLSDNLRISAVANGKLSSLSAENLTVEYGSDLAVCTDINVKGLPDLKNMFFFTNIDHIKFNKSGVQDLVANLTGRPIALPDMLNNLGECTYSGNISGFLSNFVLYGKLQTGIGNILTNFALRLDKSSTVKINGRIDSESLLLNKLLPATALGTAAFKSNSQIEFDATGDHNINVDLKLASLEFNKYTYHNILIDGAFFPDNFNGQINVSDPNCEFNFNGKISTASRRNTIQCRADLNNFRPAKLHLTEQLEELIVALNADLDVEFSTLTDLEGSINVSDLKLRNGTKKYDLDNFSLTSELEPYSAILIQSDIVNGDITGNYNFTTLPSDLINFASQYIPALVDPKRVVAHNNITVDIVVEPLRDLLETLDIKWYTTAPSHIYAKFNSDNNFAKASVNIPSLTNGKTSIDSIDMALVNGRNLQFLVSASTMLKDGRINANVALAARNDSVGTIVRWDNHLTDNIFAGEIIANTHIAKRADAIELFSKIVPSEIEIADMTWHIAKSTIAKTTAGLSINNFAMKSSNGQTIVVNGRASSNENDRIEVQLDNVILNYINYLMPKESSVSFGGKVSGYAEVVAALSKMPQLNANVTSEAFEFDGQVAGNAEASCTFNHDTKAIDFYGVVSDLDFGTDSIAIITGSYFIPIDSLDLKGHANGLNLKFLDFYLADIIGEIDGYAYGDVHVHGITKSKKVAVDVDAFAQNASVKIDFLKTKYYFSDSIYVDAHVIDFGDIEIHDTEGHRGMLSGKIDHSYFQNIKIDLNLDLDTMLVFDTKRTDIEAFYGKAYGTGNVKIHGDENNVYIDVNARTERGTRLYVPLDNYYATENSFISFQQFEANKNDETDAPRAEPTTNVLVDLMLDITPAAELQLQIDSHAGDMLYCTGEGGVRVTYDVNREELNMYGPYTIEKGGYLFTFQNIIRKEFQIREGSSIQFSGDPTNATINLTAHHQITADLVDVLDQSFLTNTARTSMPVRCILNLTGQLTQPTINFDITLPNAEDELNRALQTTLNTEEQINRQIVSLLLLGKFLNPETMSSSAIFSQNELYSVVSSTISAQLNNWASQIFDKWNFGLNFRTTGEGETRSNEYEFNFLYTPIERLSINANLGYRDDALSATKVIGDVDVEYTLTESGRLKAKAYTHTNDYREFKKGLTTQGIAMIYSESFNSAKELVQTWKSNRARSKIVRAERSKARKARREARKAAKAAKHGDAEADVQVESSDMLALPTP